jgi:hypothetical protein
MRVGEMRSNCKFGGRCWSSMSEPIYDRVPHIPGLGTQSHDYVPYLLHILHILHMCGLGDFVLPEANRSRTIGKSS